MTTPDKPVPEITIQFYPTTIGFIILGLFVLGSLGIWIFSWYHDNDKAVLSQVMIDDTVSIPESIVFVQPTRDLPKSPIWSLAETLPESLEADEPILSHSQSQTAVKNHESLDIQIEQTRSPNRGTLRVGNQTQHPIRLALLQRNFSAANHASSDNANSKPITASEQISHPISDSGDFDPSEPIHWDFAPREGSYHGLLLSLPDGDLILNPGDVLVAFAQDGSQQYWGPYVVWETDFPRWNARYSEWQLLLQP